MSATIDDSMGGEQAEAKADGLPRESVADAAAPVVVDIAASADDEEDDGTPAELEDPFAGDENAKPVEMAA